MAGRVAPGDFASEAVGGFAGTRRAQMARFVLFGAGGARSIRVRLRPVRRLEFRDVTDDDEVVPPG